MSMHLPAGWDNLKPGPHPTDAVDWNEVWDKNASEEWHLGNTRKRQELVKQFGRSSTVHGAAYVCSSGRNSSTCVKIIYRVFFVICFIAVVNSVLFLLQDSFSKSSIFINSINRDMETGIEEDPDYFPRFPRITICRRPSYRTDFNASYLELVEYVMLSFGYPFIPLTPQQKMLAVELVMYQLKLRNQLMEDAINFRDQLNDLEEQYQALKKTEHFDLTQFVFNHSINCSKFFSSCFAFVKQLNCCSIFEPVLTSNGLCFTLTSHEEIHGYIQDLSPTINLVLDLFTPPNLKQRSNTGFRFFLTDPSEEVPIIDGPDGQDVIPGHGTTIKARLIKRQRTALHTPWHSLWTTCPRWRGNATYDTERYSKTICDVMFLENIMSQKCKCQLLYHHSGPRTLRVCEPVDMYDCFFKAVLEKNRLYCHPGSFSSRECLYASGTLMFPPVDMYDCFFKAVLEKNLSDLATVCKPPCITYSFKAESSYMGVGGDNEISRVSIIYDTRQYTYNEYRKPTLSSLFSQIGGSLGLYLGASIITLFEILTFTTSWIWYRLVPAKNVTNTKLPPRQTPLFPSTSGRHHYY